MADNRFEQVDEIQPDALNLTLARKADGLNGSFHIPVAAMTMKLPKPIDSGDMDAKDAFRAAVKTRQPVAARHRRDRRGWRLGQGMGRSVPL